MVEKIKQVAGAVAGVAGAVGAAAVAVSKIVKGLLMGQQK